MPSARKFYIRRALRVIPAYWISIVVLVLVFEHEFLQTSQLKNLVLHLAMLHNWSTVTRESIDGPYWSLAVEWQFYLVLPLIAALLAALPAKRIGWAMGGLLLVFIILAVSHSLGGCWLCGRSGALGLPWPRGVPEF